MTAETRTAEAANSVTHGIGLIGATAIAPILIVNAVRRRRAADIIAASAI